MKMPASAPAFRVASRLATGYAVAASSGVMSAVASGPKVRALTPLLAERRQMTPARLHRNASSLSIHDPLHLVLRKHQKLPEPAAQHHAAMRESMKRRDHGGVSSSALKLIDEGFQQSNVNLVDIAHVELSVFYAKTAAPSDRAALEKAKAAAEVMGSGSLNSLCLRAGRSLPRGVLSGDIQSMSDLASYFGLQDHLVDLPDELQGRCNLGAEECLALSLYSGRQHGLGSTFFTTLNTVMRADLPAAKKRLEFILKPLISGMAKLPALPGSELHRGLLVGDGGVGGLSRAKSEYRPGQQMQFSAPSVGSLVAAYPGNVVLQMSSAPANTKLRDSSAFHGYPAAKEGSFLPEAKFDVVGYEVIDVPKTWAAADGTIGYCGRRWSHRLGQPTLVVHLKERATDLSPSASV